LYLVPLDPFALDTMSDKSLGVAQLSDDVLDVWADLKLGLCSFDTGFPDQAWSVWRELFDVHWGVHAVNALQAIHAASATLR
ncbi:MAG: DUF5063 domain-containing protein, partial [Kofleriaceae bacterium]|nr:DUF5063 domain-containing protein [Kofleriaceae bacterium]